VDIAVLDANDNRPEFERSVYEVRVPESAPVGSVLVQVKARDRDAGLNGNVRYKFSRHTAHEYAALFSIRPDNGKIFLRKGVCTVHTQSFDVPTTLSVTGVLRPLVHVYGTGCQLMHLRQCYSLRQFKRLLKTHLFGS